uniref:Putative secreted protein n=1 Tax=Ixodes ricinus TaxID=34613 RepID=A0A6B0U286_IXORI
MVSSLLSCFLRFNILFFPLATHALQSHNCRKSTTEPTACLRRTARDNYTHKTAQPSRSAVRRVDTSKPPVSPKQ